MESIVYEIPLEIPVAEAFLDADLLLPVEPDGLVIFAHGSGSNRFSPRNRQVSGKFNRAGFATLLLDLLTPGEQESDDVTGLYRFDIGLLSDRIVAATQWLSNYPRLPSLKFGYYGASTGAAAALIAAARLPSLVNAVVSRGGRADLAEKELPQVKAPTLLIVGGKDESVLELNRGALDMLTCEKKLEIVPGAGHLFEEPGALAAVTNLATIWFLKHLQPVPA